MKPSERCIDFVKGFEKCKLVAYLPTLKDRPTLGWGSTGPDIKLGMKWTQDQADARFATDIEKFSAGVGKLLGAAPTTQGQFDALTSFAYNCGLEALGSSTLLRMHKAGDYTGAAAQFSRWDKQAGTVLRGLTARRAAEADIYRSAT
jgi:lysozyme